MVCFDTSILIDYLKGDTGIIALVESYSSNEKLSTTSITEYELLRHHDKVKREIAQELLSTLKIYYFDSDAADESSKIYGNLKLQGKAINENDILIAGTAMANKELLVTRDSGFRDIGGNYRISIV
ncbi:MAG: type II toxin-antitoxin system VapC family toxin [Candidatus Marsarchaeota archaeon]|nr:type II toxin-antitoxin system VapC family toxin [Candidatus Marsarchaeota archaeon]MCL5413418.1 type II toxin-antitoxin system VapC family toxin [Candidatus Marsarchaeota archaeon]